MITDIFILDKGHSSIPNSSVEKQLGMSSSGEIQYTMRIGIHRLQSGGHRKTDAVCQMLVGNSEVVALRML